MADPYNRGAALLGDDIAPEREARLILSSQIGRVNSQFRPARGK
jgi:hypothetical protein